jgi:short-subunit dehydrogenase
MNETRNDRRSTALVTGASSGIGAELAKVFAEHDHDLVLVARSQAKLQELSGELTRVHGVQARVVAADLADPQGPEQVAAQWRDQGLEVDILINNAGYGLLGPFAETDLGRELGMIQLNVAALTHLTKLFLPAMLARRAGRVVNVASTAAFVPGPFMAVYYATKAYVLSFSQALANELEGTGVTVSVLCPGPTRTAFSAIAKNENSRLFRTGGVMDAATVARIGYEGLMSGKTIIVPGFKNRWLARSSALVPRSVSARVARRLNEP